MSEFIKKDLVVELFPHCNLKCDFCFQRNLEEYKETKRKLDKRDYIERAKQSIIENNIHPTNVELWGGELFYDNSLAYTKSMIDFIRFLNCKTLTISCNFVVNLEENTLFNYLVSKFNDNLIVYTSFDVEGRFKKQCQKDLFYHNLDYVHLILPNHIIEVGVVLTNDLLTGKLDLTELRQLANKKFVNIATYLDYTGYCEEVTNNLGKYLVNFYEEFPEIRDFETLLDSSRPYSNNVCNCHQKENTFLSYTNNFEFNSNYTCLYRGKEDLVKKLQDVYHCNDCEYFDRCNDVCCSALNNLKLLEIGSKCYKKELYERFVKQQQ